MSTPPPAVPSSHWVWTRPVSPKWIDAWLERLAFVGADRLSVAEKPGGKMARVEAWPKTESEGKKLVRNFGGRLRKLPLAAWFPKATETKPISFGKRLVVVPSEEKNPEIPKSAKDAALLRIPAGLAFGTGQHATTGMLLRELAALPAASWEGLRLLDAGTGSGVLALAMRALSDGKAVRIDAFDYDPQAVKTAKANEKLNFSKSRIAWAEQDVQQWKPPVRYHLACANLFSELLVGQASRFARALVPGGTLLLSGVLKDQAPAVEAAFKKAGFVLEKKKAKGKWTMLVWRRKK